MGSDRWTIAGKGPTAKSRGQREGSARLTANGLKNRWNLYFLEPYAVCLAPAKYCPGQYTFKQGEK